MSDLQLKRKRTESGRLLSDAAAFEAVAGEADDDFDLGGEGYHPAAIARTLGGGVGPMIVLADFRAEDEKEISVQRYA